MDEKSLRKLLESVQEGSCEISAAIKHLKYWPSEALDFACLDHHRALRTGFPLKRMFVMRGKERPFPGAKETYTRPAKNDRI